MAIAEIQNVVFKAPAPVSPVDVNNCNASSAGMTRVLAPVESLNVPRPISDAKGSLSNDELEKLAAKRQPPLSWYDGDEEKLF